MSEPSQNDAVTALVTAAMMKALDEKTRTELLSKALEAIVAPSSSNDRYGYGSRKGPSQLEEAFRRAVANVADKIVAEMVDTEEVRAQIREIAAAAFAKLTTDKERLASAMADALVAMLTKQQDRNLDTLYELVGKIVDWLNAEDVDPLPSDTIQATQGAAATLLAAMDAEHVDHGARAILEALAKANARAAAAEQAITDARARPFEFLHGLGYRAGAGTISIRAQATPRFPMNPVYEAIGEHVLVEEIDDGTHVGDVAVGLVVDSRVDSRTLSYLGGRLVLFRRQHAAWIDHGARTLVAVRTEHVIAQVADAAKASTEEQG